MTFEAGRRGVKHDRDEGGMNYFFTGAN